MLLAPGETASDLTGELSYLAGRHEPQALNGILKLQVEQAYGESSILEIPVHAYTAELRLADEPALSKAGDVPTLTVRIRNTGEQALAHGEFEARISGMDKTVARTAGVSIPAGGEFALTFALPESAVLNADSRLTLKAREDAYRPHDWTFPNLPIRLPTPPWWLYGGLGLLVLILSALLWSLRQYTHPLTRRLAADPAALPRLGLGELNRARTLLRRTRRLDSVLAANGVHDRWLDGAVRLPIKNFAETISIGALEPAACRELATKPMEALGQRYATDAIVERILALAGGRANLIAILCDQMLQGLDLARRDLTEADLDRALKSESLRSALEGWGSLTRDEAQDRLDRLIVYALIERDVFTLGGVLDSLTALGFETAPERIRESLTRLELAFIVGREGDGFHWQVPLWRGRLLAEEPAKMLEGEVAQWRVAAGRFPETS